MPQKSTLHKEIEEYLSGELSPEHLAEFERRIREEDELQQELEITRKVIEGIEGYAFKQMLKGLHREFFNKDATQSTLPNSEK